MVDNVREMVAEKSSKYCDSGSLEHLLIFYLFLSLHFFSSFFCLTVHASSNPFFFCNSITVLSSVSVD